MLSLPPPSTPSPITLPPSASVTPLSRPSLSVLHPLPPRLSNSSFPLRSRLPGEMNTSTKWARPSSFPLPPPPSPPSEPLPRLAMEAQRCLQVVLSASGSGKEIAGSGTARARALTYGRAQGAGELHQQLAISESVRVDVAAEHTVRVSPPQHDDSARSPCASAVLTRYRIVWFIFMSLAWSSPQSACGPTAPSSATAVSRAALKNGPTAPAVNPSATRGKVVVDLVDVDGGVY
jgi:hypothetical protein